MESRPAGSNNINFILAKSGNAADLRSVIITRTHSNIAKAVSNDHLLAVAIAVDDEIAHLERNAVFNNDLLELYRIRYECAHRIYEYLIDQPAIADNPYGKALRAYVFIHACEQEQVKLKEKNILAVSLPEMTSNVVANMGNIAYQAFVYYALEYFKTNPQGVNSRSLQGQRYANLVSRVKQNNNLESTLPNQDLLAFTIFGDNAVDANQAANMFDYAQRKTPDITAINPDQLHADIEPSAMLKELYSDNRELFAKTLSVFTSPGKFISRADLTTKAELAERIKKNNPDLKISDMKNGVVMLRYHNDLTNYEYVMNQASLPNNDAIAAWKTDWMRISKYAHTAPEYLPNFLDKLETLNQMVAALHQAVLYCREDSMQNKAAYFVELLKTKEAIQHEQHLIIDSMLARLELLNENHSLLSIMFDQNPDNIFYVNLIHDAYQKFMSLQGQNFELVDRLKRPELTTESIKAFVTFIIEKGSAEQRKRLDVILPNDRTNVYASLPAIVSDYSLPEPARPPEFEIDLEGGIVNIDDIAASDYVSEAYKQDAHVNLDAIRRKINEIKGVATSLDLAGLDEAIITENQIAIYDLFESNTVPKDSLYEEFNQLPGTTGEDRAFFDKLYFERYPNDHRVIQEPAMESLPSSSDNDLAEPRSQPLEEVAVEKKLGFFQRNPWVKYALIGFAIAAIVAVAIFVSVSTFGAGAAPGLLAVGTTVGLAFGASAASATTVGLAVLGTAIAVGAGLIGSAIAVGFRAIVNKFRSKKVAPVENVQRDLDHTRVPSEITPLTGKRAPGIKLFQPKHPENGKEDISPRNDLSPRQ